jgi:hypothetical protein
MTTDGRGKDGVPAMVRWQRYRREGVGLQLDGRHELGSANGWSG